MSEKTRVGKILTAHGVRGEMKVMPLTDDPTRFNLLDEVYIEDNRKGYSIYKVENVRYPNAEHILVKLQGVDDMDQAKALKNRYLAINKENRMPLEDDSYYIDDLVGLSVFEDGKEIGKIIEVMQPGANDVYVLKSKKYPNLCIPALKTVVLSVNLADGRMDVKLPPGLVD